MQRPGGLPNFYLEPEDVGSSPPVLRCYGKKLIRVSGHSDAILVAEMREKVTLSIPGTGKQVETSIIAITAGHGRSIEHMQDMPCPVAILLPKAQKMEAVEDFDHVSRGAVYLSLPHACLEMLGYQ